MAGAGPGHKAVGVGTGLGLATVRGIVTGLGGTLRIDSAPGAGTTIDVALPAVDPAEPLPEPVPGAPSPAAHASVPRAGGGEAILVVEDE